MTVRLAEQRLGDDRRALALQARRLDRGAQPRTARADDDDVVVELLDGLAAPVPGLPVLSHVVHPTMRRSIHPAETAMM